MLKLAEAYAILGLDIGSAYSLEEVGRAFNKCVRAIGPDKDVSALQNARDVLVKYVRGVSIVCPKCHGTGFVGKLGARSKCSCR